MDLTMQSPRLSQNQRLLVDIMRWIAHGQIENLHVRHGEPVFDPPPRVMREVKFETKRNHCENGNCGGLLKIKVVELLDYFRQMGDGMVEVIEVKNGLPFLMLIEEKLRPSGPQTK